MSRDGSSDCKTAPAAVSTISSKAIIEGSSAHRGHDISKVGPVRVKNSATQEGGVFTVWYCQNDHTLFSTLND